MKKTYKRSETERLDVFLTSELKDQNRSQIKKSIDSGYVLVNGKKAKRGQKLKKGDEIKFQISNFKFQKTPKKQNKIKKQDKSIFNKIKVVAETEGYLVVNKPSGLVVHGADYIKEISLVDWLLREYPEIEEIGEDKDRPGIVHRLDKDASGLMVIAKDQRSYDSLKKQFQKRSVEKEYKALVYGQIAKHEDDIMFPIRRSSAGNKQAAIPEESPDQDGAREAISHFEIEKEYINYSLLKVRIKTGRKHQIRVHMHAYGHPIVGDVLYNTKKTREANEKVGLNRLFLVACRLSFFDLGGEKKQFSIGLPEELRSFLKKIK